MFDPLLLSTKLVKPEYLGGILEYFGGGGGLLYYQLICNARSTKVCSVVIIWVRFRCAIMMTSFVLGSLAMFPVEIGISKAQVYNSFYL